MKKALGIFTEGGSGSGNFGHVGIPGHLGGSAPDGEGNVGGAMGRRKYGVKRKTLDGAAGGRRPRFFVKKKKTTLDMIKKKNLDKFMKSVNNMHISPRDSNRDYGVFPPGWSGLD